MNDQPNLRQFLEEVSSFSSDDAPDFPKSAGGGSAPAAIGKVLEIAGSGSQVCLETVKLQALQSLPIPPRPCPVRSGARSRWWSAAPG